MTDGNSCLPCPGTKKWWHESFYFGSGHASKEWPAVLLSCGWKTRERGGRLFNMKYCEDSVDAQVRQSDIGRFIFKHDALQKVEN